VTHSKTARAETGVGAFGSPLNLWFAAIARWIWDATRISVNMSVP
jgi:hypothetical protein